ncbi:DJ-1 family [Fusarium albosuccineum]|uniref:DJ-1 family n=1 Tax=Fusarium albosuccineum TaxID=1237068 RepID=A0A8H4LG48_9HYPO|nr:DJ-1 family [Fusarium albosuccineum]
MAIPESFKVGVATYKNLELADAACVDMVAALGRDFLDRLSRFTGLDKSWVEMAPAVTIDWIHSTTEVIPTSAGLLLKPTVTYATAPGNYDLLLVPGLSFEGHPEGSAEFLKEAVKQSKVVMTTCGRSMWLADLGLLDGKDATTNSQTLPRMREAAKDVNWQDRNWVVDGKFWTSGAAGFGELLPFCSVLIVMSVQMSNSVSNTGYGMMAEFCRKTFPSDISDLQLQGLGFGSFGSQETNRGIEP